MQFKKNRSRFKHIPPLLLVLSLVAKGALVDLMTSGGGVTFTYWYGAPFTNPLNMFDNNVSSYYETWPLQNGDWITA